MYTYVDFHNQTKSTFDKLYRVDTRDYPEIALREALLNLLALLQLTDWVTRKMHTKTTLKCHIFMLQYNK